MLLVICYQLFSIYVEYMFSMTRHWRFLKYLFFLNFIRKTLLILKPLLIDFSWFHTLFKRWSVSLPRVLTDWPVDFLLFMSFWVYLQIQQLLNLYHSLNRRWYPTIILRLMNVYEFGITIQENKHIYSEEEYMNLFTEWVKDYEQYLIDLVKRAKGK